MTTQDRLIQGAAGTVAMLLRARGFSANVLIARGCDPEDGFERLELHVIGAPIEERRELRRMLIEVAIDAEEQSEGLSVATFIHSAGVERSECGEILQEVIGRQCAEKAPAGIVYSNVADASRLLVSAYESFVSVDAFGGGSWTSFALACERVIDVRAPQDWVSCVLDEPAQVVPNLAKAA